MQSADSKSERRHNPSTWSCAHPPDTALTGGRRKGGKKKKNIKTTGLYKLLKIINPPSWSLLSFASPLRESQGKKAFCQVEVYLWRYTEQRGSTAHSEPGQRFQPSHFPNTSWYILKYFNFSALSSALSCLISCARDFFGSALDNIQERVALTCAKADFYDVNLKGEVKTTPKKKTFKKKTLNHFKGRGGKNQDAFWCKVRVCGWSKREALLLRREVCTSLLHPNVSFQNGAWREKVNDS